MELQGRHIAILTENVYEDLELHYPRLRMLEAGATVHLLGAGESVYHGKHGLPAEPDGRIDDARAEDYDAVIVPGGYSPDKMRAHPPFIEFVRQMAAEDKLVAFICHAGVGRYPQGQARDLLPHDQGRSRPRRRRMGR